jgi:hypothetical protein
MVQTRPPTDLRRIDAEHQPGSLRELSGGASFDRGPICGRSSRWTGQAEHESGTHQGCCSPGTSLPPHGRAIFVPTQCAWQQVAV